MAIPRKTLSELALTMEILAKAVEQLAEKVDTIQDTRILDIDKRLVVQEERTIRIEKIVNRSGIMLATLIGGGIVTVFIWLIKQAAH